MAKQGYPSAGSRAGGHPSVGATFGDHPTSGGAYGSHPDGSPPFINEAQSFGFQAVASLSSQINLAQSFAVSITASAAASDPLTILGGTVLCYSRADLVTIGVSFSWDDKTGNLLPWTNAIAASGPTLTASDVTLNNRPTLTFVAASSQSCDNALTRPAPLTTPTFIWAVVKTNTWTSNRVYFQDTVGANRFAVNMTGVTPAITMLNTTSVNSNTGLTVGAWKRMEVGFTGSTNDYIKVGSTSSTGVSAGNNASLGARRMAGNTPLSAFSSFSIAEILIASAIPTAPQLAQLDAYVTSVYGAGLV